jgi:lysophospholipase L1-like esterase
MPNPTPDPQPAPAWDFPAHYRNRIAQMEEAIRALPPDRDGTVVLLGDSITEVHPARELAGMPVVNMGIGGDQTDFPDADGGGVRRRVGVAAKANPSFVFVLIGVNDFWTGKPLDKTIADYASAAHALRAAVPSATLFFQSILPTRGEHAHLNNNILGLNQHVHRFADELKSVFVDLHPLMGDAQGELRSEFTQDGIHLTPPAYDAWMGEQESLLARYKKR